MAQIVKDHARASMNGLRRSVSELVSEKLEHNPDWPSKYKWPPHLELQKNVSSKSFVSMQELQEDLHCGRDSNNSELRLSGACRESGELTSESEDHDEALRRLSSSSEEAMFERDIKKGQ